MEVICLAVLKYLISPTILSVIWCVSKSIEPIVVKIIKNVIINISGTNYTSMKINFNMYLNI